MLIRMAAHADAEQVNVLRREVNDLHALGEPDIFRYGFNRELQEHLFTYLDAADKAVLVAETEDGIVGFACLEFVDRPETAYSHARRYLHVGEFGVGEGHRRQGIGRALFAAIRDAARERGLTRIELDVWAFNESAVRFYESIGFHTYRSYMACTLDENTKEDDAKC